MNKKVMKAKVDFNWYKVGDIISDEDMIHADKYLEDCLIEEAEAEEKPLKQVEEKPVDNSKKNKFGRKK